MGSGTLKRDGEVIGSDSDSSIYRPSGTGILVLPGGVSAAILEGRFRI